MPPTFFFSYAHADYHANPRAFDKLYDDLCRCVAPRTQQTVEAVGFQDSVSLRSGANWQAELIGALQTCAVFVPVYSLNYFASDICGREWGLFNDRVQSHALATGLSPVPLRVVPALWLSEMDIEGSIPRTIRDVQYKNKSYGDQYELGLENIHQRKRRPAWSEAIAALCGEIVRVKKGLPNLPPLTNAPTAIEQATSMWAAPGGAASKLGPRFVQFIFVVATRQEMLQASADGVMDTYGTTGEQWRPFLPSLEKEAILLATQVTNDEGLFFQSIDIDHDVQQRVAEANKRKNLIALVVDTWSLHLPRYSNVASLGNDAQQLNCVVVLPFSGESESGDRRKKLEDVLQATFPSRLQRRDELISIDAVRSPDAFRGRLAKALARARAAMDGGDDRPLQRDVPPGGPLPNISSSGPSA